MVAFVITIDAGGTQASLRQIAEHAADLSDAMDQIGQMLLTSTALRFEGEHDPDGNPWTPLAPSTVKAKAKSGHERILQVSGRLAASIAAKPASDSVTLGTNVVYAAIQQFGGTVAHAERETSVRLRKVTRLNKAGTAKVNLIRFAAASHKRAWSVDATIPAHGTTIPARPFLGISQDDISAAVGILQRHIGLGAP